MARPVGLEFWMKQTSADVVRCYWKSRGFQEGRFDPEAIKGASRSDFHMDPWVEIFYKIHGHIFVQTIEARRHTAVTNCAKMKSGGPVSGGGGKITATPCR
jgi:hypothetical protein